MHHPLVSIIIVSWNVREALQKNLERIFALPSRVPYEIIVVDNGSSDQTPSMVRMHFPAVQLIQNDANRGFAYACNQGLKVAHGDVLLLFNPDMVMGEGAIEHVYYLLSARRDIGVVGVSLRKPDGTIVHSVRRDPHLGDQLAILLKLPHLFPRLTRRYLARDFDYARSQEVEHVRGSFFAFRRDVFERVGYLDADRFFIWFEEVDFCRRVRQAGYRVWYSADASCVDLVGQSFRQQRLALKQARFSQSMAQYFFKWHPRWQGMVILAIRPWVVAVSALLDFFSHTTMTFFHRGEQKSSGFLTSGAMASGPVDTQLREKEHVDVAIVTVSANKLYEACLTSVRRLLEQAPFKTKFILVDNASTAFEAHSYVKQIIPDAIVILRDKNYGFGASCNRGAREVDADYYFFLNPDTRVDDPSMLLRLRDFLQRYPQVGIVAPKLLYMDGRVQETCRRFPLWYTPIAQRTSLFSEQRTHEHRRRFLMEDFDHAKHRLVDWVQGSAFMIDGKLFHEIGGFDERYFLYYEDVDLCRSCWMRGRPIYYLPEALLYHAYAKDSARGEGALNQIFRNPQTRAHISSWIKYTMKWIGQGV